MTFSLNILRDRAALLARSRCFFAEREVLEFDGCALSPYAGTDAHIDPIVAHPFPGQEAFLHTSPEYAMKRLLAAGSGDIFYLGHVFRQGDWGRLHNPEFTMAEWYRVGRSFEGMIEETVEFLELFLDPRPLRVLSYREAFRKYAGLDWKRVTVENLKALGLPVSEEAAAGRVETLRHLVLSHAIEPHLGRGEWTALIDYPPSEAALACVVEKGGERVAERFEIYGDGIELCNGYHELSDPEELRRRFEEENALRLEAGKEAYPLDDAFLGALSPRFPDCCGVSVGVDRLLLLRHGRSAIHEVLPFAWSQPQNSTAAKNR